MFVCDATRYMVQLVDTALSKGVDCTFESCYTDNDNRYGVVIARAMYRSHKTGF